MNVCVYWQYDNEGGWITYLPTKDANPKGQAIVLHSISGTEHELMKYHVEPVTEE